MSTMSKQISLAKLTLRNFKGIREYVLNPDEANVSVFGDNAAGKTTLFDAFVWLLFGKDSQNKTDFQIKTLDAEGNPLHKLEHEVEGILIVNGKRVKLRKVFLESWTRKRGSATEEFTGHTTEYFVNDAPVKKKEFDDEVSSIVNETTFKMLTNPMFFNEQMKWQDRRKALLEICGDISDAEVISGDGSLARLPALIGDSTIEQYRKAIQDRKSKIRDELDHIPARIDEAKRMIPDTSGSEAELDKKIAEVSADVEAKQEELARIQSGGEIAVKEKRLREFEGELLQIKNEVQAGSLDQVTAKRQQISDIRAAGSDLKRQMQDTEMKIQQNERWINEKNAEADRLRQEWHTVNQETFHHHEDTSCPTCGQSLPADQVHAAFTKAVNDFNLSKSQRLESIKTRGSQAASEAKKIQVENEALQAEAANMRELLRVKVEELAAAEAELAQLQDSVKDVETDPRYIRKVEEIAAVRSEITGLRSQAQGSLEQARLEMAKLRTELEQLQKQKASFAHVEQAKKRIDELMQQERELAAKYEQIESEVFLLEEFTRAKVGMLESRINGKFRYARFKLFDVQINGSVVECCETTYKGVPYSSGLNNGARINVGLDIINTLSEHYGVTAPIFIDNAESVTKLIETHGQQICLVVSEKDKQLRVEEGVEHIKEAV